MKKSIVFAALAVVAMLAFSCQFEPKNNVKIPSLAGIRGNIIIEGVEDLSMCSIIAERQINGQTASILKKIGFDKSSSGSKQFSANGQVQPTGYGTDGMFLGKSLDEYVFSTVSDENGYFELIGIPEGLYTVTASKEYTLGSVSTDVIVSRKAVTEIDIVLTATGSISGTVQLDGRTEGLQGTFVYVEGTSYVAGTDYFGQYVLMNVPTGTYDIIFYHDGYTEVETEGVIVNAASDTQLDMVDLAYIGNHPVINTVDANPFIIEPGDTVTLTASAFDPDGDDLTYTWTSVYGTFDIDTGNPVTWTTIEEDVTCKITVTVSDGVNDTIAYVNVYVVPEGILEGNAWRGDFTVGDIYDLEFISNYERVIGDLIISNTDLTDLDPLVNLTRVDGSLYINQNGSLTSISGLNNVSYIGDGLFISNNGSLSNLDGFANLLSLVNLAITYNFSLEELGAFNGVDSLGGDLRVEGNIVLTDISGLGNITEVGDDFVLKNNPALSVLDGLDSISTVGGDLEIVDNNNISSLNGLGSISAVGGNLNITRNSLLTDVSGMSSVGSVGEDLRIFDNDSLLSLDGFNNIVTVGSDLHIEGNQMLGDVDGLDGLQSVGQDIMINSNHNLEDIDGLQGIVSINGKFNLFNCGSLENLNGLGGLISVSGNLSIELNPSLINLDGLSALVTVGGNLKIVLNDLITDVDPLANLSDITGSIYVMLNDSLVNLNGLSGISGNLENLYITDNPVLNNLAGLGDITSVTVDLKIEDNTALIDLTGLNNLTNIGEDLSIMRNESLVDLNALAALDYIGVKLYICDNINLPESLAFALLNQLSNTPDWSIEGNKQE
jgi:hypothetical protein